jgi:hypothetical protein
MSQLCRSGCGGVPHNRALTHTATKILALRAFFSQHVAVLHIIFPKYFTCQYKYNQNNKKFHCDLLVIYRFVSTRLLAAIFSFR